MEVRPSLLCFSILALVVYLGVPSPGVCSPAPGARAQNDPRLIRKSQPPPSHGVLLVKRIVSWVSYYKSSGASEVIVGR